MDQKKYWAHHWDNLNKNLFGSICSFCRKIVISSAVKHYFQMHMPKDGFFIECGCGTTESSENIPGGKRRLIGLDFEYGVLRRAKKTSQNFKYYVCSDIKHLPFKENSIEGIWNVGVMEHFEEEEIPFILNEFYRVLKKGSKALLFWIPTFGSSQLVLNPLEKAYNKITNKDFSFFPDETCRLKSKRHAFNIISKSKFKNGMFHLLYRDLFIHVLVVCRK